eukprot:10498715-Alexandrium_andersonii.AAC.1
MVEAKAPFRASYDRAAAALPLGGWRRGWAEAVLWLGRFLGRVDPINLALGGVSLVQGLVGFLVALLAAPTERGSER